MWLTEREAEMLNSGKPNKWLVKNLRDNCTTEKDKAWLEDILAGNTKLVSKNRSSKKTKSSTSKATQSAKSKATQGSTSKATQSAKSKAAQGSTSKTTQSEKSKRNAKPKGKPAKASSE